jgi:plasmid stabilization system protein ParE
MPRGSKSKYTSKQKRRASKIESGYKRRGVKSGEAARRAWATVNKEEGGGKRSGSGRGKKPSRAASRKGGKAAARSRRRTSTRRSRS